MKRLIFAVCCLSWFQLGTVFGGVVEQDEYRSYCERDRGGVSQEYSIADLETGIDQQFLGCFSNETGENILEPLSL